MSLPNKGMPSRWAGVALTGIVSVVCLLLFYCPRSPQDLVCLQQPGSRCDWTGTRELFPGSGLMLGMSVSCMEMRGVPAEFYTDFRLPDIRYADSVRVWIRQADSDCLNQARNSDHSDHRLSIKAYRVDVYDPYEGWRQYVAQHPHGSGGWFAFGALAGILCVVLVVKKVFYF